MNLHDLRHGHCLTSVFRFFLPYCPLLQVLAYDADTGENGRISYSMKAGKGKHKFRMDADTGTLYAAPGTVLEAGEFQYSHSFPESELQQSEEAEIAHRVKI